MSSAAIHTATIENGTEPRVEQQLARLTSAIAERVGPQRYAVWFRNSTKFDLKNDSLEIAVPDDFISDWINTHFAEPIREAANEVLGMTLPVRFSVLPQLFKKDAAEPEPVKSTAVRHSPAIAARTIKSTRTPVAPFGPEKFGPDKAGEDHRTEAVMPRRPMINGLNRLRHSLDEFIVGTTNQLALNTISYVAEFPGGQYNPLFLHGTCGLGKTHLLQGLCRKFAEMHPDKQWMYLTGEEFTNEYVTAVRTNRVEAFRRKMRELDLLVIDDVHFLSGKKGTQEEFLHTFNAIEAMGRQVVMASDAHPRMIEQFGESLINRFISGMVVRIDLPNYATRCQILHAMAAKRGIKLRDEVCDWIAKRVTKNVRELEGAITRVQALSKLDGKSPSIEMVRQALGDLDKQMVAPLKCEAIIDSVCEFFALDHKQLMSGRRQRTISLARSVAMFLIRKNSRLSFPEIAGKLGKRNHSTVISACRRIERAMSRNERLAWESSIGDRCEEAQELIQRLEEQARVLGNG